jgi:hypothetical protein
VTNLEELEAEFVEMGFPNDPFVGRLAREAAETAILVRDEAVDRIRRQWADERRVYLALADDVRALLDVEEPGGDWDLWQRIERRLDAIARFEAGEDPTEDDTEDETRLAL